MSTVPGRGNGLSAASYVALTDLDPQLADAVLDALRVENIAAYALPATDRPLAELSAQRRQRPLDRVFVDRSASARARVLLDLLLPGLRAEHEAAHPPSSPAGVDDDVWAGIVATFAASPSAGADEVPRWPASEDLPDDAEAVRPTVGGSDDVASPDAAPPALGGTAPSPADPSGLPAPTAARGADDHFVPPPPPPLPRLDTIAKAAWIAVLGAPLLLLAAVVFRIDVTGTRGLVLVGAFVAGFVTLVARMRDDDEDSGWHDGAVV